MIMKQPAGGVNGNEDIFISKFDSSGNHLWSKRLGSTANDQGNSVAVDSSGNVIVTGYVVGNADLNGDGDTSDMYEASGATFDDVFISKFNSSGIHQWSKRLGGEQQDRGNSVAADSSGNIIVTGYVSGIADVNGDGDTGDSYETPAVGVNGNWDVFISKFNSSGIHQWSKRLGGTGIDQGNSLAVDLSGNIAVSGFITDYADLNGDMALSGVYPEYNNTSVPALYNLSCDIFVSVFTPEGAPASGKSQRFGGAYEDKSLGLAVNSRDNLLVTGTSNIIIVGYITGKADLSGDAALSDGYPEYSGVFPATYSLNDKDVFIIRSYDNPVYKELFLF